MNPIYLQALSFKDVYGTSEDCIHAAADMAAELSIAGINIEDRLLKSYDPKYLQELAHQIEGRGLRFGYCGLIVDFSAPISSIEDEINRAKSLIDAMTHLGVGHIRVPGNGVVDGQSFEATFSAVRDKFERISEYADQAGVAVYLHNHNHGSTPSTGQQVLRMLDELSHTNVAYVLDTGQFQGSPGASGSTGSESVAASELYESIAMCASRATMLRAKFYFAGQDDEQWLDYARIVGSLKNAEYSGSVSIVYEPRGSVPSTEAVPRAVRYLTKLFAT